jgi:hypothetical protein
MATARKGAKRAASKSKPRVAARASLPASGVSAKSFAAALARIAALEAQVARLGAVLQVAGRDVTLVAGGTLVLRASSLTLEGTGTVQIAGSRVDVAAGIAQFDLGILNVSGVLRCETVQAITVMASTYTPGAGNLL